MSKESGPLQGNPYQNMREIEREKTEIEKGGEKVLHLSNGCHFNIHY